MVADLEEGVDHGGVPLHADGDSEVDGAGQPYLGQGQQHRHQVGVPGLVPDTACGMILSFMLWQLLFQCK